MNENFDLKKYLQTNSDLVEKRLEELLVCEKGSRHLLNAMNYSLLAGGKRLRPVLCIAASKICSDNHFKALDCACAIEMIHTYSLIHDDLPAMDNDDIRRGILTCHKKFSEAAAILAGDGLLNMAFEVLARQDLPPEIVVETIKVISKASGSHGMISGQMRDIDAENQEISLEELENIHMEKTGALIRASLVSGAIIGGCDEEGIKNLDEYGKLIGLAFQVTDDILNVTGDPEVMGKSAGTDSEKNKATYPVLMGLENSVKYAEELIRKSVYHLKYFNTSPDPLEHLAWYILNRKK
ncbi:MAG: polyprenyl synthetase family protein [Desulfobacteraceae bacterium]